MPRKCLLVTSLHSSCIGKEAAKGLVKIVLEGAQLLVRNISSYSLGSEKEDAARLV